MGFIYKISNDINEKVYIGQTRRSIDQRWKEHIKYSLNKDSLLHRAIKKYGADHFSIEQIEECENRCLNDREKYWISYFDSLNNGYNMTLGGEQHYERNKKKCYQFSLSGKELNIFNSIADAARFLGSEDHTSGIVYCCKEKIQQYHGYIWSYNDNIEDRTLNYAKIWKYYNFELYNIDSNLIIDNLSIQEMADFVGLKSVSAIINVLTGLSKTTKGFQLLEINYETQTCRFVKCK